MPAPDFTKVAAAQQMVDALHPIERPAAFGKPSGSVAEDRQAAVNDAAAMLGTLQPNELRIVELHTFNLA